MRQVELVNLGGYGVLSELNIYYTIKGVDICKLITITLFFCTLSQKLYRNCLKKALIQCLAVTPFFCSNKIDYVINM